MKNALVVVVLCLVVSAVWAQAGLQTARSIGMGTTGVGIADDAAAWFQNPAGLGLMKSTNSLIPLASDLVGTWYGMDFGDGLKDNWSVTWSGAMTGRGMGLGAGYADEYGGKEFGAGFGMALKPGWLSWGISALRNDPDSVMTTTATGITGADASTEVNLGLMGQIPQLQSDPIRIGLTISDIFDDSDMGRNLNVGAYWPPIKSLGVAVDLVDITDEQDLGVRFNAGVEYKIGLLGQWTVRAGMMDDGDNRDFTAGVGFQVIKWRVDAAYSAAADGLYALSAGWVF